MWRPPRLSHIVATICVLSVTDKTACRAFAACVCVEKLTGDRGVEICLSGSLALSSATAHPASSLQQRTTLFILLIIISISYHIITSGHPNGIATYSEYLKAPFYQH